MNRHVSVSWRTPNFIFFFLFKGKLTSTRMLAWSTVLSDNKKPASRWAGPSFVEAFSETKKERKEKNIFYLIFFYTALSLRKLRSAYCVVKSALPWRRNAIARRPSPSSNPRAASKKMSSSTGTGASLIFNICLFFFLLQAPQNSSFESFHLIKSSWTFLHGGRCAHTSSCPLFGDFFFFFSPSRVQSGRSIVGRYTLVQ